MMQLLCLRVLVSRELSLLFLVHIYVHKLTLTFPTDQTGEAFMGKYPLEIAETYCESLIRSDPIIYADVRDDKN